MTKPGSLASIAATGMGLSCYIAGIERGFITRAEAIKRTLAALKFFYTSQQGTEADATGYKGFYYHFLDMETGKRAWKSELSTVCLLYTSDAADDLLCVDLGGRRIIKKKTV